MIRSPVPPGTTFAQMVLSNPPPGWESTIDQAKPEIELVSKLLSQLGAFCPEMHKIVLALDLLPPEKIKLVILGQDPYHTPGQAIGLAFATDRGCPLQPSLKNIYSELEREYNEKFGEHFTAYQKRRDYIKQHYQADSPYKQSIEEATGLEADSPYKQSIEEATGLDADHLNAFAKMTDAELEAQLRTTFPFFQRPTHGDLSKWSDQGVLLLNTCLTVKAHEPDSHKGIWNGFITRIIEKINEVNPECIYLLWGKKAQDYSIKLGQRAIKLIASHPSPFSANKGNRDAPAFMGCGHFLMANEMLVKQGKDPIDWRL